MLDSKTDRKGIITHVNSTFQRISGYSGLELCGSSHNLIRHPDMPRCIFQMLWDTVQAGHEFFGYMVNLAKNGDHYWVFAHVAPIYGPMGKLTGYYSSRCSPERAAVEAMTPIYAALHQIDVEHSNGAEGIEASTCFLLEKVADLGVTYQEFIFSMQAWPSGLSRKSQSRWIG